MLLFEILKGFFKIFLDGAEPVKLDLVPELSKPEVRKINLQIPTV